MALMNPMVAKNLRANAGDTISSYLTDALASGDAAAIADALGIVARTHGMVRVARDSGLARETLYRSLSADSDPPLSMVLKTMQALGLRLVAKPAKD
ncbi:MAG: addiction module antidote protein [Beijerinckiaceae bacterium]